MTDTITDTIYQSTILVVDDKPANTDLIEMMLDSSGYTNVTCINDPCLVESLHIQHSYDLILLDLRMPQMHGFEVMKMLQEQIDPLDYLPVMVLTADLDAASRHQSLELGARDFLNKPVDHEELLFRVFNLLQVRQLYKERKSRAALLEVEVAQRTSALRESHLETIRTLGRAAEFRDNETGMHVLRMSTCCRELAQLTGMDADFQNLIHIASPMHDIGKISTPDAILLKPGKLEPHEWDIMKKHAENGADILSESSSDFMKMGEIIARTHHEKWDGSGYPNGLSGEDIPIEGRIASICDVFDALLSKRPYKQAWPLEPTVELIHEESGRHFDPTLAQIFLDNIPAMVAIRERFADQ
ncbi:MAG: response regulator [Mariprofundales bacterium]|nr:response regulator [Mariprofundales bacterium]